MKINWVVNIQEENAEGFVRENKGMLVAEPQPTPLHDVEELKILGLVGIYQAKDEVLSELHPNLPEAILCADES